ncbi:MAG: hypothetical protein M3P83_09250 [Actinomycetota bacterium]|nr:hypothetical protein [Actinomycetota bacterium]
MVRTRPALVGVVVTLALIAVTASVEEVIPFDAYSYRPPLHAHWRPRVGPGTLPALLCAAVLVLAGPAAAHRWRWSRLLPAAWLAGVCWILTLALVDGIAGIADPLEHPYEYLRTARMVDDVSGLLSEFVGRIPESAEPDNWPPHVAGHPPGALLVFVGLVRIGIASGLEVGLVLVLLGATTPLAVATTLRALGAEQAARAALPFLVLTPAAVWVGVSADGGVFSPVAAWGIACLALACRRRSQWWAALAGSLLGACVFLSYGLVLLGVLAVAVLVAAGTAYPLAGALSAALAVAAVFLAGGYSWFEGFLVLRQRYYDGWAGARAYGYWVFGNLAAFAISAGPVVGAGLGHVLGAPRRWVLAGGPERVVTLLGGAGWLMALAADLSGMSKAEVERIWLPFVPWALLLVVLLPERWRRGALVAQVFAAILVQHLFFAKW